MSLGNLSPAAVSQLMKLADFSNVLNLVNEITLTLACIWAPGDVGNVITALFLKMGQSPRLLSVLYSLRLEVMLAYIEFTKGFISFAPTIPVEMLISYRFPPTPGRFSMYKIPSRFIYNFWIPMLFLVFVVVAWLIVWIIELLIKNPKKGYTPYFITRKIRVIFQNFVVGLVYCNLGDVIIYSILEFKGAEFYEGNDWFSFVLAFIFIIVCIAVLCRHVHLLIQYQNLKKNSSSSTDAGKLKLYKHNREGLQLFFKSLKDGSLLHQLFPFIFMMRVLLNSIFVGAMTDSPLVQTILIFLLTIAFNVYFLYKRPFTSIVSTVQHILFEVVFLLSNICVLILASLDNNKELALDMRDTVSEIILFTGLIFGFLSPAFLLIKLGMLIVTYYKPNANLLSENQEDLTLPVNNSVSHDGLMFDNSRMGMQAGKEMGEFKPSQRKGARLDDTIGTIAEFNNESPTIGNNFNYNNRSPAPNYYSNADQQPFQYEKPAPTPEPLNYERPAPLNNERPAPLNYETPTVSAPAPTNSEYPPNEGVTILKKKIYGTGDTAGVNYVNDVLGREHMGGEASRGKNNRQDNKPINTGNPYEMDFQNGERNNNMIKDYIRTGERRVISKPDMGINQQQGIHAGAMNYNKSRVWHRKLDKSAYRGGNGPQRNPADSNEVNFRSQIENRNRFL